MFLFLNIGQTAVHVGACVYSRLPWQEVLLIEVRSSKRIMSEVLFRSAVHKGAY